MFNGYQGPTEVIPFTDPLVAVPANLGPVTPWSVHITLAEATGNTGSVWVSWSTGVPTLLTNPAQTNESATGADIYVDDYPQPPTYNFIPRNNDSASVASLVRFWLALIDMAAVGMQCGPMPASARPETVVGLTEEGLHAAPGSAKRHAHNASVLTCALHLVIYERGTRHVRVAPVLIPACNS